MINNQLDFSEKTGLYTLQLPSKHDSIITLEHFLDDIKETFNIADETYASMLTCLSEVVINSIFHGNKENPDKKVYINLEVIPQKRLIFTVSDEGEGFDFNNLPDPTAPENIENLSGRGVYIVKKLADQCIFNAKGNEVELHFKF